jgi:hypothetical protein
MFMSNISQKFIYDGLKYISGNWSDWIRIFLVRSGSLKEIWQFGA